MEIWEELIFKFLNTLPDYLNSLKSKFLIFSMMIMISGVVFFSYALDVDAQSNQICIDKVWVENSKGKIACVTPSTASALIEREWGSIT